MLLSTRKPSVIIISWKPIFLCYIVNKGMIDWIIQFIHSRLLYVPCFCAMNKFMVDIEGLVLSNQTRNEFLWGCVLFFQFGNEKSFGTWLFTQFKMFAIQLRAFVKRKATKVFHPRFGNAIHDILNKKMTLLNVLMPKSLLDRDCF